MKRSGKPSTTTTASPSRRSIPCERLHEAFAYDPDTGRLTWRGSGREVGSLHPKGYRYCTFDGVRLQVSRVCFAMHHGRWPEGEIDHRNRVRDDNRIANLREATSQQNGGNKSHSTRNLLGVKGVQKHHAGSGFTARICGKYIGLYRTVEEAAAAYREAARERWGDFAPV